MVVMFLLGWKLKHTRSPKLPMRLPAHVEPIACAASSMTRSRWRAARAYSRSMSTARPAKCTGRMARVRGVIAASTCPRSILRESSPTSTNTGRAPTRTMTLAVATNDSAGVMTSSPLPYAAGEQRHFHPGGGRGLRAHRAAAQILRQCRLELRHLRPARQPPGAQHVRDRGDGLLVDSRAGERQPRRAAGLNTAHERATSTTPITMTAMPATRCTLGISPSSHQASPMLIT